MEVLDTIISNMRERKDDIQFKKIENVKFCWRCGTRENNGVDRCSICKNEDFLNGDIASTIAGYLELDKKGLIKKYYDKVTNRKFNAVNMNSKRVVFVLLVKDNIVQYDDREMERLIQKIMWKRF